MFWPIMDRYETLGCHIRGTEDASQQIEPTNKGSAQPRHGAADLETDCARVTLVFYRKRAFENECRVGRTLWRAFDKTVRRKPLAGAADAGMLWELNRFRLGNRCKKRSYAKSTVIDAHRCIAPRIHLRHPSAGRSIMQDRSSDVRI